MDKKSLIMSLSEKGFSEKIVDAFSKVRREDFVTSDMKKYAYADDALPIGHGQTISQPYTIAFMLSLLELKDDQKILEVGSGSGYVLALMNEISKNSELFGIERMKDLADNSKKILETSKNIMIIHGNGYSGLNKYALFDRILVSASGNEIPKELVNQLSEGGILVMPLGDSIIKLRKSKKTVIEEYPGFVFVPLVKD
jgi:protein-L-isoaspartate(D-aspartate) O-methyltransferase